MRLSEYLSKTGETQEAFGKRIGVTQGRVSQILANGTHSIAIALKIERETDGDVTVAECLEGDRALPPSDPMPEAAR